MRSTGASKKPEKNQEFVMIAQKESPPLSPIPVTKVVDKEPEGVLTLPMGMKLLHDKVLMRDAVMKKMGRNHRKISGHSVFDIPITQNYACTTNASGQQSNFLGWNQLIAQADFTAFGLLFDICRVASVEIMYAGYMPFYGKTWNGSAQSPVEHGPILLASKLDDTTVTTYAALAPLMVIGDKKNYSIFSSGTPLYSHRFVLPKATQMVTSGNSANTGAWNTWTNPQQASGLICGGIQQLMYVNTLNVSQPIGAFWVQYNVEWAVRN